MHTTHANLRGLRIDLRLPDAVHAGDEVLHIHLHNNASGAARYGIISRPTGTRRRLGSMCRRRHAELDATAAHANAGLYALLRLVITTRFLLGVFRAWSYWRPAARSGLSQAMRPRRSSHLSPRPARPGRGEQRAPPGNWTLPACAATALATARAMRCGASPSR